MYTIIGWIGMVLFLVNYYFVSNGLVAATGVLYNTLQIAAAAAIAVSLLPVRKQALSTIAIELSFIVIGLLVIFK